MACATSSESAQPLPTCSLLSTMSLPTPPGTSHRAEKENRGYRVAWSQENQYHTIGADDLTPLTTVSLNLPAKSILKKCAHVLLPHPEDAREITPEPEDPLVNLHYLDTPVSTIISADASLRDLIEAYSVLAARLRSGTTGATDVDASWPLFQPLRKHRDAFVDATVRDLGRALVDPYEGAAEPREEIITLPSPKQSPKKKKQGVSAEQVKYARDLCTASHSVMKLLGIIFTTPAICNVFTDDQLGSVLTAVLAIPLARELPTPNARKTCALSIWLLQTQRLPADVLRPARDRIACALRRGMDGELGKEGKKGSTSDSLKAIHDLSMSQPQVFVEPFTQLLPSVLANLLAPALPIRAQAAHALGGFVLGMTSSPPCLLRTRISNIVATFITTANKSSTSPDPLIVRTLRTVINAHEPQHSAQGPVWALSVLASFIVLLGPALCTEVRLTRTISALLSLGMRHKKSAVRALGCLVWRTAVWVYLQPPLLPEDSEDEAETRRPSEDARPGLAREAWWKLVRSVVDMGTGVSTVVALLGETTASDENLRRMLDLVVSMIKRGGTACEEAMAMVRAFLSSNSNEALDWSESKLLPESLFSSSPGLLTVEYKSLVAVVRPIFNDSPSLEDVRPLTREELAKGWIFDSLLDIWREGIACVNLGVGNSVPDEILEIWDGLLKANVAALQDENDEDGTIAFALHVSNMLKDIIQDPNLDFTPRIKVKSAKITSPSPRKRTSSHSRSLLRANGALKLAIIAELWAIVRTVFPHALLSAAGEKLLMALADNEEELVQETGGDLGEAQKMWGALCAEVCAVCDVEEVSAFWGKFVDERVKYSWTRDVADRRNVWASFSESWRMDVEGGWEGAMVLLGVPFGYYTDSQSSKWAMSDEELLAWEALLEHTMNKARDYGADTNAILDHIARGVLLSGSTERLLPTCVRVADIMLPHVALEDIHQLPSDVLELAGTTLSESYPPLGQSKTHCGWLLRSMTRIVELCPVELQLDMYEYFQEGISAWVSDDCTSLSMDDYTYNVLPIYETAMLGIEALPKTVDNLDALSPLLASPFYGRRDKPAGMTAASRQFLAPVHGAPPASGWPSGIRTCLRALSAARDVEEPASDVVGPVSEADGLDAATESANTGDGSVHTPQPCIDDLPDIADDEDALEFPDSDDECIPSAKEKDDTERAASPIPEPSSPVLFPSVDLLPSSASLQTPSTPTKPRHVDVFSVSPPRPHKSSVVFPAFEFKSPTSPTRVVSNPGSPSNKRRRLLAEKENRAPIASIVDRITVVSQGSTSKHSVLGKRRSAQEWQEGSPMKKGKATPDTDSDEERDVEAALSDCEPIGDSPARHVMPELSSPRKRKGVFMDAVELPTLGGVRRNIKRLRSEQVFSSTVPCTPRVIRTRSRSLIDEAPPMPIVDASSRKRKRTRSDETKNSIMLDALSSSPLRSLQNMTVIGSDDSVVQDQLSSDRQLSSDDDPHFGQVTPHHLISPTIRRVLHSDPPSDDSTMSASPTRDVAARRLQRLGSATTPNPSRFKPIPFIIPSSAGSDA
ncbi:hypothetical protein PLICRDRAFT_699960 [Plicaturopsis crispa FD-325 SS-3]|nr:hypothetical protein PLICRDRAFT_699960 [Plicaturopsis crispa FD-325 SS-3]